MGRGTGILFSLHCGSGGFEANGVEELIKRGGDVLVEPVELGKTLLLQFVVGGKGPEKSSGERGIHSFKQFEKNQADTIAIGRKLVSPRVGNPFDQPFGPKLGQVVAESGEAVVSGGAAQSLGGLGMELGGSKGVAGGDMGEAQ